MACTACGLDIPATALRDEIQAARDAMCEAPGPAAGCGAKREGGADHRCAARGHGADRPSGATARTGPAPEEAS